MRHDLEAVFAQPVAEIAGHAIEQRIAGREHDDALVAGRFDLADDRVQIAADLDLFGLAGRQRRKQRPGANQQLGLFDKLPGRRGQPFQAVVADADDLDFGWGMNVIVVSERCVASSQWSSCQLCVRFHVPGLAIATGPVHRIASLS